VRSTSYEAPHYAMQGGICRLNTFLNPIACCFLYKAKDLFVPSLVVFLLFGLPMFRFALLYVDFDYGRRFLCLPFVLPVSAFVV
jgi:hypothetical protein